MRKSSYLALAGLVALPWPALALCGFPTERYMGPFELVFYHPNIFLHFFLLILLVYVTVRSFMGLFRGRKPVSSVLTATVFGAALGNYAASLSAVYARLAELQLGPDYYVKSILDWQNGPGGCAVGANIIFSLAFLAIKTLYVPSSLVLAVIFAVKGALSLRRRPAATQMTSSASAAGPVGAAVPTAAPRPSAMSWRVFSSSFSVRLLLCAAAFVVGFVAQTAAIKLARGGFAARTFPDPIERSNADSLEAIKSGAIY